MPLGQALQQDSINFFIIEINQKNYWDSMKLRVVLNRRLKNLNIIKYTLLNHKH